MTENGKKFAEHVSQNKEPENKLNSLHTDTYERCSCFLRGVGDALSKIYRL